MSGPMCRWCGKPIKKKTEEVYFNEPSPSPAYYTHRTEDPKTKAEAQRLLNVKIVAVRSGHRGMIAYTWDGESYQDPFFCAGSCARAMGYYAARRGVCR